MTCKELLALLDAEGAVTSAEVLAHARSCAACGRALERWQQAQRELRAMAAGEAPPFLAERVMARVRAEQRMPAPGRRLLVPVWRPVWLAPALATMFVIALGGYGLWRRSRPELPPAPETLAEQAPSGKRDAAAPQPGAVQTASEPGAAPPWFAPAPEAAPPGPAAAPSQPRTRPPAPPALAAKREAGANASGTGGRRPDPVTARRLPQEPAQEVFESGAPTIVAGEERPPAATALATRDTSRPVAQRREAAGAAEAPEALGAVMKAKNAEYERRANAVALVLAAVDGSRSATIHLAPEAAPPAGMRWLVNIAEDGAVRLRDDSGRAITGEHPAAVSALHAARQQPGEYWLSRQ